MDFKLTRLALLFPHLHSAAQLSSWSSSSKVNIDFQISAESLFFMYLNKDLHNAE